MGPLAWKLVGAGTAALAGIVANRIATEAWRRTGRDSSLDPYSPDVPIGQALAFVVLTAAAVGAAKVIATRQATAFYRRSTGHLPPGVEQA